MELSEYELNILNELQDQDEPFEAIDIAIRKIITDSRPERTLAQIFKLYKKGYISIFQRPINPLNQTFLEKEIIPNNEIDCVGDLQHKFYEYCKKRDYLEYLNKSGLPFGIWIDITKKGRAEFSKKRYNKYWDEKQET